MSYTYRIIFRFDELPTNAEWQAVLDEQQTRLKLDPDFDVASNDGYLPTELDGKQSGFEFDIGPLQDEGFEPEELKRVGTVDAMATFKLHLDDDHLSARIAAAAFAVASAGLVVDEEHPEEEWLRFLKGDEAFRWACHP